MKLRYFLTSIVACLTLAIGCTKEDLPGLSEIQVTPSYFTFGVDGGAKELTVTAVSDWAVSDVPEWLTVTPASGTATPAEGVKVTVTAAATTAEKIVTGTIKFTCAGKTQLVTVGQEAFVPDYPKFEAGEYWIMFGEEVAVPVSSSYGYLYTAKASKSEDGKLSSTADNIFTFTAVEGGFTIQDANGMYYYMKGTYTSFNLDASPVDGSVFTVKQTGDDKFIITNANGKVMQYDPAYSSAGAYDTEKAGAIYPNLVSVAGGEIAEVLFAVEPTEVSVEKAAGEFNINMTCKTGAFEINPSADWITLKGMTSTNGEYVVTFSYTENTAAARTATIDFVSGEETISVAVVQAGSIAEISVADFLALEKGEALYKLTGKVSGLKAGNYGNFHLVDATGSVYVYGLTATPVEKNDQSFPTLGIREGDIVTIIGKRDRYDGAKVENEKDQVGGPAYYVSHVGSTDVTVAEFLAKSKDAEVRYRLTGKITNLKTGNYGNFHLEDATGSVYVYGLTVAPVAKNDQSFPTLGLKEGDVVTLVGTRDRYDGAKVENEKDQVGGPAYYVSHEAGATEPEPETPATKAERNLAFSAETASATLGEAFTAPTLSGEATGVAYSSSNTAVATVDAATGAVTLVAAGETTITATAEETETLLAGTASYTLTVAEAAPAGPAQLTVAEFLAKTKGDTEYKLTGVIKGTYNTTYGNFYLKDETGEVLVYGLTATKQSSNDKSFASLGLRDGDTLTLIGKRDDYNGTAQVGGPAYYVSHVAAPFVDFAVSAASVEAEATTYTIEVQSNTDWTAAPSTGVTLDKTSGNGNASVVMTFAANTTSEAVKHSVVFTVEGATATFELTQKAVPAAGAVVLLEEDFSSLTAWETTNVASVKVNNLTYATAGGSMYKQKGCLKFGKSSAASNTGVKLPKLADLSGATNVTLTFKAVSSDSGYTMAVSATGGATVGTLSPKAITAYGGGAINSGAETATKLADAFAQPTATFSVTIENVTADTEITIVASGSAKRWYLDDIKIEKN